MEIQFSIAEWAAYAPGLPEREDWERWSIRPYLPAGFESPALSEMPAMHRRRLIALGRMATKSAYDAQGDQSGMPVVFASRYGDAERSLQLLGEYAMGNPVSPTDFAFSVHNAIGAVYSIARKDTSNFISIAAGPASAATAIVEACGLLEDGASQVLVVCYDAPLPGDYATFEDEPSASYAWAWRVTLPMPERPCFSLQAKESTPRQDSAEVRLPFGLDVQRFVLGTEVVWARICAGTQWHWRRHD